MGMQKNPNAAVLRFEKKGKSAQHFEIGHAENLGNPVVLRFDMQTSPRKSSVFARFAMQTMQKSSRTSSSFGFEKLGNPAL